MIERSTNTIVGFILKPRLRRCQRVIHRSYGHGAITEINAALENPVGCKVHFDGEAVARYVLTADIEVEPADISPKAGLLSALA